MQLGELAKNADDRVRSLSKSDIVELKAFKSPPKAVVMMAEAMCIVFSLQPSYQTFQRLSSNADFMQMLITFRKQAISDYALDQLASKYINDPDFSEDYISKVSRASGQLCMWIRYIYEYGRLYSNVSS